MNFLNLLAVIEINESVLFGVVSALAGTIATMAAVIWGFMKSRLDAQDKLIVSQTTIIVKLQEDVDRMSKGCGSDVCHWRSR